MRIILAGLGNVGRSFLEVVRTSRDLIRDRYGLSLAVVGVADSTGAAFSPDGLDLDPITKAKSERRGVATLPTVGHRGMTALDLLSRIEADILLEATPANFEHGEPGLGLLRAALGRGIGCVM